MKPFIGQKGHFYSNNTGDKPEPCEVTRVWSDSCVDLVCESGFRPTSVRVGLEGAAYCFVPDQTPLAQPPIAGYRQLSQAEADLINSIKSSGAVLEQLLAQVKEHLNRQSRTLLDGDDEAAAKRHEAAEPHRWFAMARTDLQTGLMRLVRSVVQPGGF